MGSTGAVHDSPPDVPNTDVAHREVEHTFVAPVDVSPGDESAPDPERLRDVSLRWSDVGFFLVCYAALVAVWFALGKVVVNSSAITTLDESVADWWVDHRTPALDTATVWGSGLADTFVKIAVTALLALAMRLAWKRWREPLMMVVPLVLEAAAFITVTYLIARPRPDDGMESSPVDSSFPSGHVAAAAAYSALVIIVFWHTRKWWIRALVIVVAAVIPMVVAISRMYRGMHFLSDVIAGAALGFAAVALSWWLIRRAVQRSVEPSSAHVRVDV
jgi:membrane-associated phospholipid phosphatase